MIAQIGKYKIEKELGRGGFGDVLLAFDPDVGNRVAIKYMRVEFGSDPDMLKRFHHEIRTTASLRHKNIVGIFASGVENGNPYLVMEYLEGRTLKEVIGSRSPLSLLEKVGIMTQIAEGLAYAHSKGVVHRDVKPENIMLLPDGTAKIMDFGIALAADRKTVMTQVGGIIGTPSYIAPEQLKGQKANQQTDIFSFGDVYYELLTGQHPFQKFKQNLKALQHAIIDFNPEPASMLAPECPDALDQLVRRMIAKEPELRYANFEELLLDSKAILADLQSDGAIVLLREAATLVATGDMSGALSRIRSAQQLDPGNREARQLRESITQHVQKPQIQARLTELLTEAQGFMTERRFSDAVQSLESAEHLDHSNVVVQRRLDEARARLDGSVRANHLVSEARFHYQKGRRAEALERLTSALAADRDHPDALGLYARLNDPQNRDQRQEQIQSAIQNALRTASDLAVARRFSDALAVLLAIERDQPGVPEVGELRARIQQAQAQTEEEQRIRAEQAEAQSRAQQRESDIQQLVREASGLSDAGDLRRAHDLLMAGRQRFGDDSRLVEFAQALEVEIERRRLALQAEVAERQALAAKRQAGAEATRLAKNRQAEIDGMAESVRRHLQRDDTHLAAAALAAARAKYPGDPNWAALDAEIAARSVAPEQPPNTGASPASRKTPWKLIGGIAAAVAAIAAGVVLVPRWLQPDAIAPIPVEVRSVPAGALVKIGDQSCVTPACQLNLAPGLYRVEAQLKDYARLEKTVMVDAANHLLDLRLQRVSPLSPGAGKPVVSGGQKDAVVPGDGKSAGRTDSRPAEAPAKAGAVVPSSEEQTEAREWVALRNSTDLTALYAFVGDHPDGAHKLDALAQIESVAWSRVNKDSADALQAFLKEFGTGPHKSEATSRLTELGGKTAGEPAAVRIVKDPGPTVKKDE